MAYVRLEQTNCYNSFGIVRFLGSRILVDVNWRRSQFTSYQNYTLVVVELCTAFGLGVAGVQQILQNAVMYIIDNQIVTLQKSTTMLINAIEKKK